MSSSALEHYRKLIVAAAVVFLLPALWSFVSAVHSATTTGEVLVISVGRYETTRHFVPWANGWARFAGPIALAAAVAMSAMGNWSKWPIALLATTGVLLLFFSKWFTSVGGAAGFCALTIYIALAALVDKKLGRIATIAMLVSTTVAALWLYASRQ